jgi:hypothetical protein
MNLYNIISEIEKADPEVYNRLDSRRKVISGFTKMSGKIALATVPLAFGSMFQKAYGQTTASVTDVLQFALTLEYLEAEFYTKAVAAPGLLPAGAATGAITTIRDHEVAHVEFLKTAIMAMGATPVSKPEFDFSGAKGDGNGPFKDAFSNYDLFLAVAQTFEDTGVRAYKGQAGNLISNNDVLTAALNIHSVEARHAAHIRSMRRATTQNNDLKPWITGKDSGGIGAAVQASYDGEEITSEAGVNIVNINGQNISMEAAS